MTRRGAPRSGPRRLARPGRCPPRRAVDSAHGVHARRPSRPGGQPAVPGHDELRPAHHRGGQPHDHGHGRGPRASTSSTPPTCTGGTSASGPPRRSSADGSPRAAAAATRSSSPPRSTARWATGPTSPACRSSHIRQPARRRCGACAPTTSTSTRCTTSIATRRGTRSGRRWSSSSAGQGPLRRLVELRRLAHRARQRDRRAARHSLGLATEQTLYNLHAAHGRARGDPRVPGVRHGADPYSPLAGGLLAGALRRSPRAGARRTHAGRDRAAARQLEPWEALCKEFGERPADVALAWLLHQPAVTAPIIGPRTEEQLLGSMRALEIALADEVSRRST